MNLTPTNFALIATGIITIFGSLFGLEYVLVLAR